MAADAAAAAAAAAKGKAAAGLLNLSCGPAVAYLRMLAAYTVN
jgi:hypothetical protein